MYDGLTLDAQTLGLPISSAPHMSERYQCLIGAVAAQDAPAVCDHSKTFLETVFRTIVVNRNGKIAETPDARASFVELYNQAKACLNEHESDKEFLPVIKKAVIIIGAMRNNYGASSHGQDGYHERKIELVEATFIARLSLATSGYMYARHMHTSSDHKNSRLHYEDSQDFNDYLDSEGDVEIAGILVAAPSKILFDNDPIAYKEKLIEYENDALRIDEAEQSYMSWAETQADIARGK